MTAAAEYYDQSYPPSLWGGGAPLPPVVHVHVVDVPTGYPPPLPQTQKAWGIDMDENGWTAAPAERTFRLAWDDPAPIDPASLGTIVTVTGGVPFYAVTGGPIIAPAGLLSRLGGSYGFLLEDMRALPPDTVYTARTVDTCSMSSGTSRGIAICFTSPSSIFRPPSDSYNVLYLNSTAVVQPPWWGDWWDGTPRAVAFSVDPATSVEAWPQGEGPTMGATVGFGQRNFIGTRIRAAYLPSNGGNGNAHPSMPSAKEVASTLANETHNVYFDAEDGRFHYEATGRFAYDAGQAYPRISLAGMDWDTGDGPITAPFDNGMAAQPAYVPTAAMPAKIYDSVANRHVEVFKADLVTHWLIEELFELSKIEGQTISISMSGALVVMTPTIPLPAGLVIETIPAEDAPVFEWADGINADPNAVAPTPADSPPVELSAGGSAGGNVKPQRSKKGRP